MTIQVYIVSKWVCLLSKAEAPITTQSDLLMRTVRLPCVLFFLLPISLYAQRYKPYSSSWKWAATAEVGSVSPGYSLNAEYSPVQFKKSFVVLRAGIGYLSERYSKAAIPHAITWAVLLNGKERGCPLSVPEKALFLEIGAGGAYLIENTSKINYVGGPIIGLRRYFMYNERATGFLKIQAIPLIADRIMPWGGVGIGLVID